MATTYWTLLSDRVKEVFATQPFFNKRSEYEPLYNSKIHALATLCAVCLNKPHLLILVKHGNVVSGGYSSIGFDGASAYRADGDAFLFKVKDETGADVAVVQKTKSNVNHVYSTAEFIAFGGGHDLGVRTNGTILCNPTPGTYPLLDGKPWITGNTAPFEAVEVYIVRDVVPRPSPLPPRYLPISNVWTDQESARLRSAVIQLVQHIPARTKVAKVIFFGGVGAGKSTFISTCESVLVGRVAMICPTGTGVGSLTTKLQECPLTTIPRICFVDNAGWERNNNTASNNIDKILDGCVPKGRRVTEAMKQKDLIPDHQLADDARACCAVIMVPANEVPLNAAAGGAAGGDNHNGNNNNETFRNIADVVRQARERNVPVVILISKLDCWDTSILADVKNVCSSTRLKQLVDVISDISGIPPCNIFPISNNIEQYFDVPTDVSILALRAMQIIISRVLDYFTMKKLAEDEVPPYMEAVPPQKVN